MPQPEVSVTETEVIEDIKRRLREVVDSVSNYPSHKKQRIETISKVIVNCVEADRSVIFIDDDKHSLPLDAFIVGLTDRSKPDTQELKKRAWQALLRREIRIVEPSPPNKHSRMHVDVDIVQNLLDSLAPIDWSALFDGTQPE